MGLLGLLVLIRWFLQNLFFVPPNQAVRLVRRFCGNNSNQYQLQGACLYNSIEEGPNGYQTWTSHIGCFPPPVVWSSVYQAQQSLAVRLVRRLCGNNSNQYQLRGACLYNSIEEGLHGYQTWTSYIGCFPPPVVWSSVYQAQQSLAIRLVARLCGNNSNQYQLQGACLYNSIEEGLHGYQTWTSYIGRFPPR